MFLPNPQINMCTVKQEVFDQFLRDLYTYRETDSLPVHEVYTYAVGMTSIDGYFKLFAKGNLLGMDRELAETYLKTSIDTIFEKVTQEYMNKPCGFLKLK